MLTLDWVRSLDFMLQNQEKKYYGISKKIVHAHLRHRLFFLFSTKNKVHRVLISDITNSRNTQYYMKILPVQKSNFIYTLCNTLASRILRIHNYILSDMRRTAYVGVQASTYTRSFNLNRFASTSILSFYTVLSFNNDKFSF